MTRKILALFLTMAVALSLFAIPTSAQTTLRLNRTSVTLAEGGSFQLRVQTNSRNTVRWATSDSRIARVNQNGQVRAIAAGRATIAARVDGVTVRCQVTVRKATSTSESTVKKGDSLQFGGYTWKVLEVKDGKALIISEKIIESRPYSYITNVWIVTWENSDLRAYLNGEFYNSFKSTHKSRISTTTVKNNDNQWYGTPGGADTQDKIFLLSLEEVVKYFGDSGKLKNRPANDVHVFRDEFNDKRNVGRWWWLRSPGNRSNYAAYVGRDGTVFVNGEDVSGMVVCDGDIDDDSGVRPALWLNL